MRELTFQANNLDVYREDENEGASFLALHDPKPLRFTVWNSAGYFIAAFDSKKAAEDFAADDKSSHTPWSYKSASAGAEVLLRWQWKNLANSAPCLSSLGEEELVSKSTFKEMIDFISQELKIAEADPQAAAQP